MRALVRPGSSGSAGVRAMRQRLARLGVTDVGVISPADPATELAAVAGALRGRTMLVDADLIVADACLGQLIDDPAVRSGALVMDVPVARGTATGVGAPTQDRATPVGGDPRVSDAPVDGSPGQGISSRDAAPTGVVHTPGTPAGSGPDAPRAPIGSALPAGAGSAGAAPAVIAAPGEAENPSEASRNETQRDGKPRRTTETASSGIAAKPSDPAGSSDTTIASGTSDPNGTAGTDKRAATRGRLPAPNARVAGINPPGINPLGSASPVRSAHRRIASAGSAVHQVSAPGQAFVGALVVDAADRDQAAKVLAAAADTSRFAGWDGDPVDLALVALVRGQVPMAAVSSVGPVLRGGTDSERAGALAELDSIDEARVLLERANRPDDGFYSTFVLRRASKPVTSLALRLRLSPNQISLISLVVGLGAAACFAWGSWPALLAGGLLLQASLIIDCVDGEVARFTRSFSALGAWLDAASDRVKEYAAYAGLAFGAARSGADIWLLATLVMVMQTVRHVGDYDFSRVQRVRESWVPARALLDPTDGGTGGAGATLQLSAQLNTQPRVRWAKKVLHMPIGERWFVLSVGAVTVGPRWTLLILLGLGLLAFAYTTAGRILRSARWRHPPERSGSWLLVPQLDLGPIGEPLWNLTLGRLHPLAWSFGWVWPVLMRAVELGAGWWIVREVVPDAAPWLFAWTFVVAFHHYDLLYRVLGGAVPPRWLSWFGLGWEGRTILVLLAGWAGASAVTTLLHVGTPPLALLFVVIASIQWVRYLRARTAVPSDA